ncbi:MAG: hypothetical protein WCJ01_11455 [Ignavibacteria bacterium]
MVSGLLGTASGKLQTQVDTTNELTDEQKAKIKEITAKYEAKQITEAEEQRQIAEVKASGTRKKQEMLKSAELIDSKTAEKATASTTTQNDVSKQLTDLMNDKKSGNASQNDVNDFVKNLKSSLDSDQGMIVDKKA